MMMMIITIIIKVFFCTEKILSCLIFAVVWSGRFNVLASDPERYSIVLFCSERLKKSKYVSSKRTEQVILQHMFYP